MTASYSIVESLDSHIKKVARQKERRGLMRRPWGGEEAGELWSASLTGFFSRFSVMPRLRTRLFKAERANVRLIALE
jgi:hypothetical protein